MNNQEIRELKRLMYNLGSDLLSDDAHIRRKAQKTLETVATTVVQLIDLYHTNADIQEIVDLYGQYTQ